MEQFNTICYECQQPCARAGKQLSNTTRECNGWKDEKFVGCAGLESPTSAEIRLQRERLSREHNHEKEHSPWEGKTAMQVALENAGVI